MRNAVRRAEGIEANARVVARRAGELCEDSRFDAARTLTIHGMSMKRAVTDPVASAARAADIQIGDVERFCEFQLAVCSEASFMAGVRPPDLHRPMGAPARAYHHHAPAAVALLSRAHVISVEADRARQVGTFADHEQLVRCAIELKLPFDVIFLQFPGGPWALNIAARGDPLIASDELLMLSGALCWRHGQALSVIGYGATIARAHLAAAVATADDDVIVEVLGACAPFTRVIFCQQRFTHYVGARQDDLINAVDPYVQTLYGEPGSRQRAAGREGTLGELLSDRVVSVLAEMVAENRQKLSVPAVGHSLRPTVREGQLN
jgi:hypothetical protein